ncbi:sigma-54 interaction domain-containing protein [Idiomarina xiamenensis]|uniref:Sigma-54 dependent transcription regulator n=1 Tax=Idiomarina xiamenensis 10-D-4 TaxID=740709 RepID=K2KQI6_9GAMM|nr:sigma-54 dependent transcriptional regulator [Idiomarina xiamenensis]EKE84704.1 sigma-54 dependent transcription regulator [Idiomarina xiamenensis 10-D-4]
MGRPSLFIFMDDLELLQELQRLPVLQEFIVTISSDTDAWPQQLQAGNFDAAIIEAKQFDQEHFDFLNQHHLLSDIDFIFLSSGKPNPYLDKMMLRGAGYHFRKPYHLNRIGTTLSDFHEHLARDRQQSEKVITSDLDQFGLLVGSSKAMLKLYRTIRKVAQTSANVFIVGESGAGKELVANTIHAASERTDHPFVALNCGALSPELVDSELFGHVKGAFTGAHKDHQGVFEQARGGTLFLDEVTEMPLEHQVKLLRVLESGEFRPVGSQTTHMADVRIVAATNREPIEAINDELFREDLYFRLAQFPLQVPPLRDRGEDIIGLAKHFLAYRNAQEKQNKSIDMETLKNIKAHPWPGNVRELKHTIERAYILADDIIMPEHLILQTTPRTRVEEGIDVPAGMSLEELEQAAIERTLASNRGNKSDTAQQLGISVKTLYNKLGKYQQRSGKDS